MGIVSVVFAIQSYFVYFAETPGFRFLHGTVVNPFSNCIVDVAVAVDRLSIFHLHGPVCVDFAVAAKYRTVLLLSLPAVSVIPVVKDGLPSLGLVVIAERAIVVASVVYASTSFFPRRQLAAAQRHHYEPLVVFVVVLPSFRCSIGSPFSTIGGLNGSYSSREFLYLKMKEIHSFE